VAAIKSSKQLDFEKGFKIREAILGRNNPHLLLLAPSEVPLFSELPSTSDVRDCVYDAIILKECQVCSAKGRINGDVES
jgi:hypothetical protein